MSLDRLNMKKRRCKLWRDQKYKWSTDTLDDWYIGHWMIKEKLKNHKSTCFGIDEIDQTFEGLKIPNFFLIAVSLIYNII